METINKFVDYNSLFLELYKTDEPNIIDNKEELKYLNIIVDVKNNLSDYKINIEKSFITQEEVTFVFGDTIIVYDIYYKEFIHAEK